MSAVRRNVYSIIGLVAIILFYVVFSDIQSTMEYDPNSWAKMSIALGASMLTVVGIFASIMTSDENSRRAEFTDIQNKIRKIVEGRERYMPDGELKNQYNNTLNKIDMLIEERAQLRFKQSYVGFGSFFSFLISAMSAIFGLQFEMIWAFFLVGIGLIIGYVSDCIIEFDKMDKDLIEPARSTARLGIQTIMVNDQEHILYVHQSIAQKLQLFIPGGKIEVLDIPITFQGIVRNGHLHAIITYDNNKETHIPHRDTFLMDMGFIDDYQLATYGGEDTGVLNSEGEISLTFNIPLRIDAEDKELVAENVDFQWVGGKDVYKNPSLSDDFRVRHILLRMLEDPYHRPNRGRREIAKIEIEVKHGESARTSDLPVKPSRAVENVVRTDLVPSYPYDKWEFLWFKYTGNKAQPWGKYLKRTFRPEINFNEDWALGEVDETGEEDKVGFRASRTLKLHDDAVCDFEIGGDDGIRLSVWNMDSDVVLNISSWRDQGYRPYPDTVTLPKGNYKILLEWYEMGGAAQASFDMIARERGPEGKEVKVT